MRLCSDEHEEVCFDADRCPCCKEMGEKDRKIAQLELRIEQLDKE